MSVVQTDYGNIINFLQENVPATETEINPSSLFSGYKQVVGGEGFDFTVPNTTGSPNGVIIDFPSAVDSGTGGSTSISSIVDISQDLETGKFTATTGEYATLSIPWSQACENIMYAFGIACLDESKNAIMSEIYNSVIADTFNKPHISEYEVEKYGVLAFVGGDGRSYITHDLVQKIYVWLVDTGILEPPQITPASSMDVGMFLSDKEGYSASALYDAVKESVRLSQNNALKDNFLSMMRAVRQTTMIDGYDFYSYAANTQSWIVSIEIICYRTDYDTVRLASREEDLVGNTYFYAPYIASSGKYVHVSYRLDIPDSEPVVTVRDLLAQDLTGSIIVGLRGYAGPSTIGASSSIGWSNSALGDTAINRFEIAPNSKLVGDFTQIPIEFPDWWQHIVEIGTIDTDWFNNPDAHPLTKIDFLPLPMLLPNGNPATANRPQAYVHEGLNPYEYPYPDYYPYTVPQFDFPIVPKHIPTPHTDIPFVPVAPTPQPPSTVKDPNTDVPLIPPVVPIPIGGNATALFTVYNPSQSNLNALGGYLWSSDILEQLIRMFSNNPLDAVISLQVTYVTPSTSGSSNIILGYLDAGGGTNCPLVNNQYVTIDCGTVSVNELFGDARDYAPYTNVTVYLPFIGFKELKTEDIVAGKVNIKYNVDVYTGTCVALISVIKNGVEQLLYNFEGNCSTTYPLTGADHSRIMSGLMSVAVGGMTGGAIGAGIGAVSSIAGGSMKPQILRSGAFSGNAGAMAYKKPYLVINRDVAYDASFYNTLYGYPANKYITLSSCSGFTRVKEVHVDNCGIATSDEKAEIERLLKEGVIV